LEDADGLFRDSNFKGSSSAFRIAANKLENREEEGKKKREKKERRKKR